MKALHWVTDHKQLSLDVVLVSGAGLSLPFGGAVVLILIRTELHRACPFFVCWFSPKETLCGGSQHINIFRIIFVNLLMNLTFDLATPKCTHLPAADVGDSHLKNQDDDSAANKQTNKYRQKQNVLEGNKL